MFCPQGPKPIHGTFRAQWPQPTSHHVRGESRCPDENARTPGTCQFCLGFLPRDTLIAFVEAAGQAVQPYHPERLQKGRPGARAAAETTVTTSTGCLSELTCAHTRAHFVIVLLDEGMVCDGECKPRMEERCP